MLRRSFVVRLFTKPAGGVYQSQLPPCPPANPARMWRRATTANGELRRWGRPDAARYEEWYKSTYGVEDVTDGSCASGASSNRRLSDEANLAALRETDVEAVLLDLESWDNEFRHNTQLK